MDFLTGFWGFGGSFLSYALPFLFVLTVVVFFHELGHFWVARRCGVKVDAFAVGFGPELIGFNDRHGTRWKLCAIPLGGYVRFYGDDSAASTPDSKTLAKMDEAEKRVSFFYKPVSQRAAVVAAGPIANFILAIVIFSMIFMIFGRQVTTPRVDTVQPGSAAAEAGLQTGDMVLSIDGEPIKNFGEMQRIVSGSPDVPLKIVVQRGASEVTLTATPRRQEIKDNFGNTHRVGLLGVTRSTSREEVVTERYGPLESVKLGVAETWFVVERTLSYIGGIVRGTEATDQLGGPIRIAQISGQVATVSFAALLHLTAVLSVSIGLLNLFPVPLLDGGHLVFYAIEAIRGRPLSERAQEYGFRVGLALVLMLMLFATWNDIVHLTAL
ncbi:MAG TPA: RIP metalloprotease RseP [Xanthobacteraceae bacterium]|nr:RIP metalloprotease RseP [Xanthobacteraceae bacterium]